MNFFSWKSVPFVRFLMPLLLGIITAVFFPLSSAIAIVLIVSGIIGLLVTDSTSDIDRRMLLERWALLPISLLLFGLGVFLVNVNTTIDEESHFSAFNDAQYMRAVITEVPQSKAKSIKLVMDVNEMSTDSTWTPVIGKLLVYVAKEDEPFSHEIGDELLLLVNFKAVEAPANPGEFDYKRFLSFRDIYHQQYVPTGQWKLLSTSWSLQKQSERIRSYLRSRLDGIGMDGDQEAIAAALLLGKKDELGPSLTRSYASAGAMHVLAVSGLHVGIVFFILQFFLRWMDRIPRGKLWRALILMISLWVYAFVTGLSPSVVRAATMFSAMSLATGLDRRSNIYNTVASSAFILLIFNPLYIMEVGFQLSYLAVVGIIYLHPKVYSLMYFPEKLPDNLWEISAVSISAQLATFPLGLLYFHQFPSYFLLSNLIVIPAAFFILYVGIMFLAFGWIPFLGDWIGQLLAWSIRLLNGSVAWVEQMPYSLVQGIDISIFDAWLIYLIVGALSVAFIYQKKRAFVLGLALTTLIAVLQLFEQINFKSHRYLVVYDVRGEAVVNLVGDDVNLLYCDEKWNDDLDKQQFHLKNNWNRHAAPAPLFIKDSPHAGITRISDALFLHEGRSFMVVDELADTDVVRDKIAVDFLVLSYHKGLSLTEILEKIEVGQIILDASIRGKTIARMRKEGNGQQIHAIQEDGYYAVRL